MKLFDLFEVKHKQYKRRTPMHSIELTKLEDADEELVIHMIYEEAYHLTFNEVSVQDITRELENSAIEKNTIDNDASFEKWLANDSWIESMFYDFSSKKIYGTVGLSYQQVHDHMPGAVEKTSYSFEVSTSKNMQRFDVKELSSSKKADFDLLKVINDPKVQVMNAVD